MPLFYGQRLAKLLAVYHHDDPAVQGDRPEPSCGNGPCGDTSKANSDHGHCGKNTGGHDWKIKKLAATVQWP